jgi:hypothetical protein
MRRLLGLILCAGLGAPVAGPGAAQPATAAAPAPAGAYRSSLSANERANLVFQEGLDADEAIGAEVVGRAGETVGTITDLLVGEDGRVERALVDVGASVGAGSRSVVIELARLRRTGDDLALDMDEGQLAALPAYRRVGERWVPGS